VSRSRGGKKEKGKRAPRDAWKEEKREEGDDVFFIIPSEKRETQSCRPDVEGRRGRRKGELLA